jgi:protein ImuA
VCRGARGRPFASGLASLLGRPVEVLYLEVGCAVDVLWAMEEALGCPTLSAVIGEVCPKGQRVSTMARPLLITRGVRGAAPPVPGNAGVQRRPEEVS